MQTKPICIGAALLLALLAPLAHAHGVGVHAHAETDGLGHLLGLTISAAIVLTIGVMWLRRYAGPRADAATTAASKPLRLRN